MSISTWFFAGAILLIVSTFKRPTWLGGPLRRNTSDDSATAEFGRGSRRSLGGYLIIISAVFWMVGM